MTLSVIRTIRTQIKNTYLLVADLHLTGTSDVQIAQLRLQLRVQLELQQSLTNLGLELIGLGAAGFDNLSNHLEIRNTQEI